MPAKTTPARRLADELLKLNDELAAAEAADNSEAADVWLDGAKWGALVALAEKVKKERKR